MPQRRASPCAVSRAALSFAPQEEQWRGRGSPPPTRDPPTHHITRPAADHAPTLASLRSYRYWEVDDVKADLADRIVDAQTTEALLADSVHAAAFYDSETLGRPTVAPLNQLDDVTAEDLSAFVDAHFVAGNMVIVGAGARHKDLVEAAEQTFGALANASRPPVTPAEYVGGEERVHLGASGAADYSIALPTAGSADASAAAVLAELIASPAATKGFGASATASSSFAATYADAGLVGVTGATLAEDSMVAFDAVAAAFKSAAAGPSADALAAAKARAASAAITAVESQETLVADMGAAIAAVGSHDVAAKTAAINAVSAADVQALAASALAGNVSYAVVGDARAMPRHNRVASLFK